MGNTIKFENVIQWTPLIVATITNGSYIRRYFSANVDFGHDFSGHYNRLALISVDIISGIYCNINKNFLKLSKKEKNEKL